MRWLIEITDITDQRFLGDLLDKLNIKLFLEENRTYLISDDFELLSTSSEVRIRTEQVRDVIAEVGSGLLNTEVSFKLGTLYEQREDGSRSGHIFLSAAVSTGVATVVGFLTVTSAKELSEEERAKLEAERLEREYQDKLALVSSRVLPALRDERALEVHRLLQQELNPLRMGHIMDLIQADIGRALDNLAGSKNELKRFYHSINHPEVFGYDSRHIISDKEPPRRPMSLSETQAFVSRVADLWFKGKSDDNNA